MLDPVIGKQIIRKGQRLVLKLGETEVDYDPNFRWVLPPPPTAKQAWSSWSSLLRTTCAAVQYSKLQADLRSAISNLISSNFAVEDAMKGS